MLFEFMIHKTPKNAIIAIPPITKRLTTNSLLNVKGYTGNSCCAFWCNVTISWLNIFNVSECPCTVCVSTKIASYRIKKKPIAQKILQLFYCSFIIGELKTQILDANTRTNRLVKDYNFQELSDNVIGVVKKSIHC
jgi:hypothetical protein